MNRSQGTVEIGELYATNEKAAGHGRGDEKQSLRGIAATPLFARRIPQRERFTTALSQHLPKERSSSACFPPPKRITNSSKGGVAKRSRLTVSVFGAATVAKIDKRTDRAVDILWKGTPEIRYRGIAFGIWPCGLCYQDEQNV